MGRRAAPRPPQGGLGGQSREEWSRGSELGDGWHLSEGEASVCYQGLEENYSWVPTLQANLQKFTWTKNTSLFYRRN